MSLKGNLNILEKIIKKYKNIQFQQKKNRKVDKDGNKNVVTISYKIKFIVCARFMTGSLSNIVDKLAKGIHKIQCKNCNYFLESESVGDKLMK